MARIQKLESDSSFNIAQVPEGQILVYTVHDQNTGRVYHRAKLNDNSIVTIGQQQDIQNAVTYYTVLPIASQSLSGNIAIYTGTTGLYIKGHTYQCLQLNNTYRWLDITPIKQDQDISYIVFDSTTTQDAQISVTFNCFKAPIGLYTNHGNYYPIQKSSVQLNFDYGTVKVVLNPYLAYDNQSSFQGTWLCFFSGGNNSDSLVTRFNPGQYMSSLNNLKRQVSNRVPWPTNSKVPGYVLTASSNSAGVVWSPGENSILSQNYYDKYQTVEKISSVVSSKLSKYYTSSQVNDKLASSFYNKSQIDLELSSYITSDSLQQHLSSKIDMPTGGNIGNVLIKANNSNGVVWGAGADAFVSSDYYTKQYINSHYYTSAYINNNYYPSSTVSAISSALNTSIGDVAGSLVNKIDMPASTVSSGYVLMKATDGVIWGSVNTSQARLMVSSGTTAPQNPVDGMLWIDPSQAPTSLSIVFSTQPPENPYQGLIWCQVYQGE